MDPHAPPVGSQNVRLGLVLLPIGLLGGLALSLFAFQPLVPPPRGLEDYAALPRRLLRLGHIAAVMLPVLNIVIGSVLNRLALTPAMARRSSLGLLAGMLGLPATLAAEALVPGLHALHPSGLPALALTAGAVIAGIGGWRTSPRRLAPGGAA
jgi:hypothetical protein